MGLAWSTDVGAGDWVAERVHGFGVGVGSVVPHGFDAYARVFHPIEEGPYRRWSDLAAANGRVAHPEMQYHLIRRGPGDPLPEPLTVHGELLADVSVGSLPRAELTVLAGLLARHTATPDACWFAVWEGFGQLRDQPVTTYVVAARGWNPIRRLRVALGNRAAARSSERVPGVAPTEVRDGPRLELPNRAFHLLHGAVADAAGAFDLLERQSPNLWWPDDRAWCVATEIDFGWTYVGGSEEAVADVLASPDLEALPARISDGVDAKSDQFNERLDDG